LDPNQRQSTTLYNQYSLKYYNENYYKLVVYKSGINASGFEKLKKEAKKRIDDEEFEKEENNLSRVRSIIFEYAMCNNFEYFVTLTLDKQKQDRYDLQRFIKQLGQFIRDHRKKTNTKIEYLLIPEKHKDGAYHMHGLFKGLSPGDLMLFTTNDNIPGRIKNLIHQGHEIYNWIPYSQKFGWVTLEKIRSVEYVSKYITKYIKKDIGTTVTEMNKKSYYCTKGLKKAVIIKKGTLPIAAGNALTFNYENDYIKLLDINKYEIDTLLNIL